jgi:hypothetical protein
VTHSYQEHVALHYACSVCVCVCVGKGEPLSSLNWNGSSKRHQDSRLTTLRTILMSRPNRWLLHQCETHGCKHHTTVVLDGNEKLFRYCCKAKLDRDCLPAGHQLEYASERIQDIFTQCHYDPVKGNQSNTRSQYCEIHKYKDEEERQRTEELEEKTTHWNRLLYVSKGKTRGVTRSNNKHITCSQQLHVHRVCGGWG